MVSPSASGAPSRRARACEGGGRWTALNGIDWTNCAEELHLCHAKKNTKSRAPFPQRLRAASNTFLPLENCKLCAVEDFMLLLSWYLVKTELGKFSVIDYDACFCPNPTSRHFAHCTPAKCAIWSPFEEQRSTRHPLLTVSLLNSVKWTMRSVMLRGQLLLLAGTWRLTGPVIIAMFHLPPKVLLRLIQLKIWIEQTDLCYKAAKFRKQLQM